VVRRVLRNRGKVLTMMRALNLEGVEAPMTVEGGTSGAVFLSFVGEAVVPALRPGDLVALDNLGAHHATGVKEAIRAACAEGLPLPPYGPDLNPLEQCWRMVKALLCKLAARGKRRGERRGRAGAEGAGVE
jgi:transposase